MKSTILPAVRILLVLTILTGVLYPVAMTLFSNIIFPYQSKGSMIKKDGAIIGSELIGQRLIGDKYFHSRPSAIDYNPAPSSGTNWGPTDKRMQDSVKARTAEFKLQNNLSSAAMVPKEILFASASGVDPHISPEAAQMQIERIARVRGFTVEQTSSLKKLVEDFTQGPQMKLFGKPRVNVLTLNLAVDRMQNK